MGGYGAQDMVAPLRRVIMHRPNSAMTGADPAIWHYAAALDGAALAAQYEAFAALVAATGAEILWTDDAGDGLADAVFTHDPSLVTAAGAVLLNMGKALRQPEVALHDRTYRRHGIPILGRIADPGRVEGGDCVWLDRDTLTVGRGFRTNQAGIDQLAALLEPLGVEVVAFDLPMWEGEAACLHLMSLISLLDQDLALIYRPLLPVALYQLLIARGVTPVEAPVDEFAATKGLCLNILAVAPRHGVMIDGAPETVRRLVDAGCRIDTFPGDAICIPCEGGPTCMTRPVLRS
ncbi:MAG: amidinotransferase [Alphaproteobacteria bacterium]|nr:amidinotransferase [Alphaproteobacteria bacterium]